MAQKTFKKQLEELAEKMSHEETREEAREELTSLLKEKTEEIAPPEIRYLYPEAQKAHIATYIRQVVQIKTVLDGKDAAQKLKNELYERSPKYRKRTEDEKLVASMNAEISENRTSVVSSHKIACAVDNARRKKFFGRGGR